MSADDSISSITVDTPIAMISVFDRLLGIFMGLTDECFVVKSAMKCPLYHSPLWSSVKTDVVAISESDAACTLEAELLARAVVEMVVTSAVAII